MKTDVFISGGGVGGLTLALKLAQRGVNVTVAERLTSKTPAYKGELLQPKSMQIFDGLGLFEEIEERSNEIKVLDMLELSSTLAVRDQSFLDYSVLPGKYNAAYMAHHEELKSILREAASQYPNFSYLGGTTVKKIDGNAAHLQKGKEKLEVQADYFIGAEGRASVTRKAMDIEIKQTTYNHHFLTVTFPRAENFRDGKIISTYNRFLGLFPLPDNQVRSVYLIPEGDYQELKEKPISHFHKLYTDLAPSIDGYVQQLQDWKKIQLMIPVMFHAPSYVKENKVIIGDAAHAVHPMAGEGMNMAIQDADVLGELLADMAESGKRSPENLHWFEKVRYKRAEHVIQLSHLSALAYSFPFRTVSYLRTRTVERMEEDPILHFKQMLNVSGLGMWKENVRDRFIQGGIMPVRRSRDLTSDTKELKYFTREEDYPWKVEGLL
ncbi:FAD-dependent oxidoreductase [Planococcus glaciei]|uniref:FAD-dependent oxidoreductase n=1 Tax=Planococcus glaciei TaxID=459472 RepID=UPI0003DF2F9E|nr:NAD(P)/FAD-dependent oxidoreductase [Planococcus glaciei]ETP68969.1 FAD-dependent oxidoreductase [Planococcus glaciei CHR43]MBX0316699.1 FAD-dependent monooxygenase [Planococcus glaciei]SDI55001.1 2-polyprenyl-6-methoxyphenol hydroxylase [Planococcus glaciei]